MSAPAEPTRDEVRELLLSMTGRRVLVVGDGMIDEYVYGSASRIAPEAPVQVVQVEREEHLLGGAANVAKCLVALGAKVTLACVAGDDNGGARLVSECAALGIDTSLILRVPGRSTTVKSRVVCGRQQLLRVDRETRETLAEDAAAEFSRRVCAAVSGASAVLLSDYNKGVLTSALCQAVITAAREVPVVCDPKGIDWQKYRGATVIKPNYSEALAALNASDPAFGERFGTKPGGVGDDEAGALAGWLRERFGAEAILLTRGPDGMTLCAANAAPVSFRSRAATVLDEAGAGDSVAATLTLALAADASLPLATWLGNAAAGVKVSKFGTHAVADHEILEAMGEIRAGFESKLVSAKEAARRAESWRAEGKKVVFTNGCFDILHLGHVTYLEQSRRLGGALIVGVNTDESVRRLKGPSRPVNNEGDRARVIASQASVDCVVLFGEDTPLELIREVQPDVLCKGADYKRKEDVVGWDVVEARGGRVALVQLVDGRSSSHIIGKMRDR